MENILCILYCVMTFSTILTAAEDYCKWQTFEPNCAKNEVVMVEKAYFGRMQKGGCIQEDYGNIGCRVDVTSVARRKCSGRKTCSIVVPDKDMDVPSPCPDELLRYLSISHSCLKVVQPNDTSCSLFTRNLEHGFIASQTTDITGCGKTTLPWRIKASPGQIINVTIHDFTRPILDGSCQMYATFKENLIGKYKTMCGGRGSLYSAYVSSSHELEVRLQTGTSEPKKNFLLEFQVQGCQQMEPPANGWSEQITRHLAHVGCLNSDVTWSFNCEGHQWRGDYPTCEEVLLNPTADAARFQVNTPFSVIIVVCVALLLGLSILVTGICILKRKNHPYARAGPRANHHPQEKDIPPSYYGTAPPSYFSARNITPDHEYEYVSDIINPNSVATTATTAPTTTGSAQVTTSEMNAGYTGTGYGTVPPAQNAQLVIKGGTNATANEYVSETVPFPCPKYFELDTTSQSTSQRVGDNMYKSLHHCAHNSKQQFGHYSQ